MSHIILNGNSHPLVDGQTVAALIDELDLAGKPVAVEVNFELVPKADHAARRLNAGDRVELVTLVGGG